MTTRVPEQLPDELVFEPDGHVGEVALACLADGEAALLPAKALAHVEACERCTAQLGAATLLSLDASEALREGARKAQAAVATEAIVARVVPPVVETAKVAADVVGSTEKAQLAPSSRRRRPLPRAAIGVALLVAAVASAPSWLGALSEWQSFVSSAMRSVTVVTRVAAVLLRSSPGAMGTTVAVLRWVAAVVLIVSGLWMARAMSRRQTAQGGVR